MLEDKWLVSRCKRGNSDALCRIYSKYKDYLLTLAKALLNDKQGAEDVVHDVFVTFARSLQSFRLTGSLRGYLAACTCNRSRDIIRSRARQSVVYSDLADPPPEANSPEQNLIEQEQLSQLRCALVQIPYEQREAVLLHTKGELTLREIAKLQNVSVSTISGRYRYGIDKLRSILNGEVQK